MHESLHTFVAIKMMTSQFLFEWLKHVVVTGRQIGTVWRMLQCFPTNFGPIFLGLIQLRRTSNNHVLLFLSIGQFYLSNAVSNSTDHYLYVVDEAESRALAFYGASPSGFHHFMLAYLDSRV